ncbi:uncharacterized protein BDW43DRAFT_240763 [Aspergillus alliaceus]|uniref:uncharacterized protein n=1 Tax=Petromyces alliaceus TaxID=209559 RepID=UPI0012A716CF|nr:uncharacterized protein BDW43DRAFT_240763 [Aspergillus alliaceus]KAB8236585.1 hypothetical protein BDW43DRAFT_240763 [Aspergillus alliaceus]
MGKPLPSSDPDDLPPPYEQVISGLPPDSIDDNPLPLAGPSTSSPITNDQTQVSIASETAERPAMTLSPFLSRDPAALHSLISHEVRIPPRPSLSVRGAHQETRPDRNDRKENRTESVVDFDFRINLSNYLVGDVDRDPAWHQLRVAQDGDGQKLYRGGRCRSREWKRHARTRAVRRPSIEDGTDTENVGLVEDDVGPDLMGWCERFCQDPSPVKSFTFTRHIENFNSSIIQSSLTSHLRSLNYQGNIQISTSFSNQSFTVYSPHWINRARNSNFIYWICLILQLWLITWPIIWFLERRYAVVGSVWLFSREVGSQRVYARDRDEADIAEDLAPVVTQAAWERRLDGKFLTDQDMRLLRRLEREGRDRGGRVLVVNWDRISGWGRDEYS